jgi:hypothetical protein
MPTKEMYKKYEGNQTKDKVVDSSAGGLFKGEHWSEEYAKTLDWTHPSQDEINEMAAASHKPTTSYEKMPDYIKDKPAITEVYSGTTYDIAYENNQEYLGKVGASQEPGKRIYGAQDD